MTRVLLVALALAAALFALAYAQPVDPTGSGNFLLDINLGKWKPDVHELCALVGENGGCSSCTWGTDHLCSFIKVWNTQAADLTGIRKASPLNPPRNSVTFPTVVGGGGEVTFSCVPTKTALRLMAREPDYFEDMGHLCPLDAKMEPIIRDVPTWYKNGITVGNGNTGNGAFPRQNASTLLSITHSPKHVAFPTGEAGWPVDRTSRWGKAGGLMRSMAVGASYERATVLPTDHKGAFSCETINSRNDMRQQETLQLAGQDFETTVNFVNDLFQISSSKIDDKTQTYRWADDSLLWSERDKWCMRTGLNAFASTRCPRYGAAVSGWCQTSYTLWQLNCGYLAPTATVHLEIREIANPGVDYFQSNVGTGLYTSPPIYPPPPLKYGIVAGMRVVDDATPWCVFIQPLEITGELEGLVGLHKDLKKINTVGTATLIGSHKTPA